MAANVDEQDRVDRITLPFPDDFHHHLRNGDSVPAILPHVMQHFGRVLCMPNLKPPVTTTERALVYYDEIMGCLPKDQYRDTFKPLMTLYLTDNTTPEEIKKAHATGKIVACKYYPAGASTNSEFGVTDAKKTYPALKAMEECGMLLLIHSEVARREIDIFDRCVAKYPKRRESCASTCCAF